MGRRTSYRSHVRTIRETPIEIFRGNPGDAHLEERGNAILRLVNLHEDQPAAFSVDFVVGTWKRMVSDYNESCRDGVRRMLRMLLKWRKRDQVARKALSANRDNSPVWHFPMTFNMDRPHVFWHGVTKPESEWKEVQQLHSKCDNPEEPIRPTPEPTGS